MAHDSGYTLEARHTRQKTFGEKEHFLPLETWLCCSGSHSHGNFWSPPLSFQKVLSPQRPSTEFYNSCSALWCFVSTAGQETRKTKQQGFCRAFPKTHEQGQQLSRAGLAWSTATHSDLKRGAWWLQHIHLRFVARALWLFTTKHSFCLVETLTAACPG